MGFISDGEAEEGGALAAFSGRNSETEREGRGGGRLFPPGPPFVPV